MDLQMISPVLRISKGKINIFSIGFLPKRRKIISTLVRNKINSLALWSARAVGAPRFEITAGDHKIPWVSQFKYLGYWFTPKLGFGTLINKTMLKIRKRIGMINSERIHGSSSGELRKVLFFSYVLPLFTWLFPLYPLFSVRQQQDLNHFYYICLKRVLFCPQWSDNFFAYLMNEKSLEDRCLDYWNRYFDALAETIDGELLFEQANFNTFRASWLNREFTIKRIFKSKRFVTHLSTIEKSLRWCTNIPTHDSIPNFHIDEVLALAGFPETF